MSKSNYKLEEKFVGAAISRPHFGEITKKENGITLIALIITIIVMLILVGVTLSITLGDNGLVNKAKEAAEQTQIAMDSELLFSAVVGAIGEDGKVDFNSLDMQLPTGFQGSKGKYISSNSYEFVVTETGEIIYIENSVENNEDLDLLRRYFLGEIDELTGERPGRNPMEVVANPEVFNGGNPLDTKMKGNEIIPNAYSDINVISYLDNEYPNIKMFITYNNNYYTVVTDLGNMIIKSVQELKISLVDIEGRYNTKWDTQEEFYNEYFEIENNTYTYYEYDFNRGDYRGDYSDYYFNIDYSYNIEGMFFEEENNMIYIIKDNEENIIEGFVYEIVYENNNVVNIILKDLEEKRWVFQNYNGLEFDLDGTYVESNAEYPEKLIFTNGSEFIKMTRSYWSGTQVTETGAYYENYYFKYKGIYYLGESYIDSSSWPVIYYSTMEVSDDLTTIVYGGKTYVKQ